MVGRHKQGKKEKGWSKEDKFRAYSIKPKVLDLANFTCNDPVSLGCSEKLNL